MPWYSSLIQKQGAFIRLSIKMWLLRGAYLVLIPISRTFQFAPVLAAGLGRLLLLLRAICWLVRTIPKLNSVFWPIFQEMKPSLRLSNLDEIFTPKLLPRYLVFHWKKCPKMSAVLRRPLTLASSMVSVVLDWRKASI